jgi:hypothetical protein
MSELHHPASPIEALRRAALADLDATGQWVEALAAMMRDGLCLDEGSDVILRNVYVALWEAELKIARYREIRHCSGSG